MDAIHEKNLRRLASKNKAARGPTKVQTTQRPPHSTQPRFMSSLTASSPNTSVPVPKSVLKSSTNTHMKKTVQIMSPDAAVHPSATPLKKPKPVTAMLIDPHPKATSTEDLLAVDATAPTSSSSTSTSVSTTQQSPTCRDLIFSPTRAKTPSIIPATGCGYGTLTPRQHFELEFAEEEVRLINAEDKELEQVALVELEANMKISNKAIEDNSKISNKAIEDNLKISNKAIEDNTKISNKAIEANAKIQEARRKQITDKNRRLRDALERRKSFLLESNNMAFTPQQPMRQANVDGLTVGGTYMGVEVDGQALRAHTHQEGDLAHIGNAKYDDDGKYDNRIDTGTCFYFLSV